MLQMHLLQPTIARRAHTMPADHLAQTGFDPRPAAIALAELGRCLFVAPLAHQGMMRFELERAPATGVVAARPPATRLQGAGLTRRRGKLDVHDRLTIYRMTVRPSARGLACRANRHAARWVELE